MHNPIEQTNPRKQACVDGLRRLPAELPPPYHWQEFQRRARLRSDAARGGLRWGYVAAAAAVLLVVCAIAVWGRIGASGHSVVADSGNSTERAGRRSKESQRPVGDAVPAQVSAAAGTAQDVAAAATRARAIESWLATLPREPAVVRVGTHADVTRLQDRIAQVDDLLTSLRVDGRQPDRLAALQRQRVQLVGSLAQVRYAEVLTSESP
jgi:hypothetical protein